MSLINDALKKAQKSQTQQPATAAAPVAPISARMTGQPGVVMNFERILLLLVALVAVLVGATAVTVLLLRKDARPIVAQAANPAPILLVAASSPAPSRPIAAAPAPVRTSADRSAIAARPVIPTPARSSAPQAAEPVSAPLIAVAAVRPRASPVSLPPPAATAISVDLGASSAPAVANVEPTPPAAQPAPPSPTPPQDAKAEKRVRILSFIENAHVAGVRLAGDDSKVLMNEHVYRLNNLVSMELGLRLTGVAAAALTFVDENGVVYTKTF